MKIKELHILYFILVLNAFASIFTGYFEAGGINPGTIRGGIVGIFILYFIFAKFKLSNTLIVIIFLFIIYLGFLTVLSSSFLHSFYLYIGVFISLMMLPVGYYYINTKKKLFQLTKILLVILGILTFNIFISNVFQLGESSYLEGSFYFGGGRVNITKTIIIILFTAPIYLYLAKPSPTKNFAIIIYVCALIICLIGIKRSVLLSLIIGIIIFIIKGPDLVKSTKYYVIASVLLLITFPLYGDVFTDRFEARHDRVNVSEETLNTEGRYMEVLMVYNAFESGNWRHRLIGSDIFYDTHFFKIDRMLHTDYMIILNGAGLIGIFVWFLLLYLIIQKKNEALKYLKKTNFIRILNAVLWMLIIGQIVLSISGTLYEITLRSYIFVCIGAILKVLHNKGI